MNLFKLVGSIFVDTEEANNSLSKTDQKASSVGETLGKVGQGAVTVGTAVIGSAAALGTAMVSMASSSAQSMDVIDKASQRMNISAEAYQELAHAANLSGVEMGTLEQAAKKLEGMDINLDEALAEIYEMETAEERSAKAAELFGDSVAYKMTPMLNASGEDMANMRQEAHDLGLVFSEDMVSAGATLNDALGNVHDSFTAMTTSLGGALMPVVQEVADAIIGYLPTIQGMFAQLGPLMSSIFENIMPQLMSLASSLLPVIFQLIEELLPPISNIITALMPVFVQLITALMPFIVEIANMVLPVIVKLLEAIIPILNPIVQLLSPLLNLVTTLLSPLMELINMILPPIIELGTKLATLLTETISKAVDAAITVFNKLKDSVKTVFEQIKEFVKKPVNAVIGFLNGLISGIVGGINGVIRALNKFHINVPDWVTKLTGVKTFGFNLSELSAPQIPLLAKGADIEGEGSAMVGEKGPELLELPKGARVTPLGDNAKLADKIDTITDLMRQLVTSFRSMGVYLDTGAMVGQLAPGIDVELGRIAERAERWA